MNSYHEWSKIQSANSNAVFAKQTANAKNKMLPGQEKNEVLVSWNI